MIDYTFFMGLDEKARLNLIELGYDEEGKHDCCNGHYYDYDWSDFDVTDGYGDILSTFASLGYNETSWNDTSDSLYENSWWDALPLQVQYDAYDWLCFNKELWNEVELPQWPRNATLPGMYKEDGIYDYYDVEEETKEEKEDSKGKETKEGNEDSKGKEIKEKPSGSKEEEEESGDEMEEETEDHVPPSIGPPFEISTQLSTESPIATTTQSPSISSSDGPTNNDETISPSVPPSIGSH